uniref:JHL18I08.3 protein n=1 Tax=Rhizophora mucronata TaxID=61149 RepID=A0A2P2NMI8_RHIMU
MNGYMHMVRNTSSSRGICGINMLASYPKKTSPNPPPPPSPGPTRCNLFSYCAAGETCCCSSYIFGICFSWKCCEFDSAVCCKDRLHCCPYNYPICDTERNMCLKHAGNATKVERMKETGSSGKSGSWSSFLEAWVL